LSLSWQIGSAWIGHRLSHDAALLERSLERAALASTMVVAATNQLGLPRGLCVGILKQAEHQLRVLAEHGRDTPDLRLRKVAMLLELVQLYGALGEPELLRARASEAEQLLVRIAAETSPPRPRDLAASYDRLGDVLRAYGLSSEALASYRAGAAWAERLAVDDVHWRHELAVRLGKIGNGELEQGALNAALDNFQRSRLLAEAPTAVNSGNPRWRHALQIAHERIGDIARLRGDHDAALQSYMESRLLAERLVAGDAANAQWQHLLARSHLKIGDVHRAQNESEPALASYRAAHAIAGRLAAADPAKPEYLAVAQQRLGLALEARADATSALAEYRASLAIAHRLAAAAPGDAELQFDLASSHARLGMAWEARGELEAALGEYEAAIAIALRYPAGDKSNARWQRKLVGMHARLAGVLHPLGKSGQALIELRRGRDIATALLKAAPGLEPLRQQFAYFESKIAALEGRARPAIAPVVTLSGPPKL
jgi:tetratricopeptide (TPR) repeat protein